MSGADVLRSTAQPTRLDTPRYLLGEGPAWNTTTRTLSWIDIEEGIVVAALFEEGALGALTTLHIGGVVGCAIPISEGRFLVSLEAWIGILHPTGRLDKSRALITAGRRFNDGKIDPQGRLVVGSLARHAVDSEQHLLRLEHDGSVTVLDSDLHQSNGMGWSPDGSIFYNADTSIGRIYKRSYHDGVAGDRNIFIDMDGVPDGLTVDMEGNLWVAVFDRARVDCFAPDGSRVVDRTVRLDGHHPTSVEFIGPDLDQLVITTGFPRMVDPAAMALQTAHDGTLFITRTGSSGVPTTSWHEVPLPR